MMKWWNVKMQEILLMLMHHVWHKLNWVVSEDLKIVARFSKSFMRIYFGSSCMREHHWATLTHSADYVQYELNEFAFARLHTVCGYYGAGIQQCYEYWVYRIIRRSQNTWIIKHPRWRTARKAHRRNKKSAFFLFLIRRCAFCAVLH